LFSFYSFFFGLSSSGISFLLDSSSFGSFLGSFSFGGFLLSFSLSSSFLGSFQFFCDSSLFCGISIFLFNS
jgi:hypothetical protein